METLLQRKTEETDSPNYTHLVKVSQIIEYRIWVSSDDDNAINEAVTMLDSSSKEMFSKTERREAEIVDIRE